MQHSIIHCTRHQLVFWFRPGCTREVGNFSKFIDRMCEVLYSFGFYRIDDVPSGETYTIAVEAKRFVFVPRELAVNDNTEGVDFIAEP